MKYSRRSAIVLGLFFALLSNPVAYGNQSREHLTHQEIDLVKEAQALDKRIDVFIKAANRRVIAINGAADSQVAKQLKKDAERWGELPKGSRSELLRDIARILDEAITNIDDVSARDERNPLIPKALRSLGTETMKIVNELKHMQGQAGSDAEVASFEALFENAESIIEAANKLPPPEEKKKKR